MSTYRRCRLKYKFGYLDDLEPKPGLGLVRGGAMHEAVGAWYGSNLPHGEERSNFALQAASNKLFEFEQKWGENADDEWYIMEVVLRRYFDWATQNDPMDFEKVLGIEEKFVLELEPGILITGFIDGLVRDNHGRIYLLEHKFLKSVSRKALDLDPQVSLYLFAAHEMGYNPYGVFYNIVRMTEGGKAADHPVDRHYIYRNPEGFPIIRAEVTRQIKEMKAYHNGRLPTYRNPQDDCFWSCGFYQACLSLNFDGQADAILEAMPKKEIVKLGT